MRVIGFDAATDDTVIAATRDGVPAFESTVGPTADGRPDHSRALLSGIAEAVASLGGWDAVDRIAVGVGPGTFTGLRIAVATASGLSMSTGRPVVGVSTLEATARSIAEGSSSLVPVLDAKRGEVFTGAWDAEGGALLPARAVAPEGAIGMIDSIEGPVRVGGPGAVRFRDLFADAGIRAVDPESEQGRLRGIAICEIGAASPDPDTGRLPQPIYLREPDAKLWLQRDGRPAAG